MTVDLFNDTDTPELVHWHGQIVPAAVDGAAEEKSLVVPAHGQLRYRLTPQPSGARFVHTHVMSMSDLNRGTYTGQFGFVYIEPKSQSRTVRSGDLSRHPRMGAFLHHRRGGRRRRGQP